MSRAELVSVTNICINYAVYLFCLVFTFLFAHFGNSFAMTKFQSNELHIIINEITYENNVEWSLVISQNVN